MVKEKYELVVGLEVHAQLSTKSKLFCGYSAAFGTIRNTQLIAITLVHPGTLPKMNKKAIEYAVKLGLALHCNIMQENYFARKNYFYPDLPKGYQISQHTTPICRNGYVRILSGENEKQIPLNRIHIEEDAGKSLHDVDEEYTSIDLNRAGVPLLEIVSEPAIHSAEEAFAYITELRKLVRWLGVCDGNMEEGSMRCDANISVRLKGETRLGTRVEVKNLNSIRHVKKAIEFEADRLIGLVENGEIIQQQTRSFDADKGTTFSLRSKEDADDYRYFPEPDLTPFHISDQYLEEIRSSMPELPETLEKKYINSYHLSAYDARVICDDRDLAAYFESTVPVTANHKSVANWLLGPVKSHLNETNIGITGFILQPAQLVRLIDLVEKGQVSFSNASSKVFQALLTDPTQDPLELARQLNLLQESDTGSIEAWVDEAMASMPEKVKEYRSGKKGLIGLFAGEVKKLSKGKADMQIVNLLLEEKLKT